MNPKTEEIVKSLRGCSADVMDCKNCVAEWGRKYGYCFNSLRLYAADRLEKLETELSKLKAQQRWIPVTERLPEDDDSVRFYKSFSIICTSVLVYEKERGVSIANRLMIGHSSIKSFDELATDGYVWSTGHNPTHWMSLPEPPKEETHESERAQ